MSENEKLKQEVTPVADEELKNVNGGSTHNYNGKEFDRVYSFTSCTHRYGEKGDYYFNMAPHPGWTTPIYKAWWDCSLSGQCGCCKYLYIDGASDGICWSEHYYGTLPPDHEKRGY